MSDPFEAACEGYGPVPAKIMFIGISAGKLGALQTGVPFTKDASGRLFQRCLFALALSRTEDETTLKPDLVDTYVTNLVKGRILDEKGNNRQPTEKEVEFWMPTLIAEIEKVKPRVLVSVGEFVYRRSVGIPWKLIRDNRIRLATVNHPRWYSSKGALKPGSPAFLQMFKDYWAALFDGPVPFKDR